MKIALVNSEYPTPTGSDHGGIATYTGTLASLLTRHGHTVHVFTRSGVSAHDAPPDIHYHQFGFEQNRNYLARFFNRFSNNPLAWEMGQSRALATLLLGIAKKEGLDLVEFPEYGGLACSFRPTQKIPCVITFHTPSELVDLYNAISPDRRHRQRYALEAMAIKRACAFKSPSNALKKWVCSRYRLSEKSVTTIRNPFDDTPIRQIRRNRPDVRPPSASRFDILFSGRFERRKGAELLLNSIKDILAINDGITFTIAGETDTGNPRNYRQAIERILTPQERLRVWFPGPLTYNKLLPLYFTSSLFLFPSLFENSPYSLLEAMAAGLPVVAADAGGITEIVTHNETGLLFPPDDRVAFIEHIKTLFNDPARTAEFGKNAHASVQKIYDPEKIINEHCAFYQSVCSGGN